MSHHIGLLFRNRLDTTLLRHRIRKCPDSPPTRYRIRCDLHFSTPLESGFKSICIRYRIHQMRVDRSRIQKEKVADLNYADTSERGLRDELVRNSILTPPW